MSTANPEHGNEGRSPRRSFLKRAAGVLGAIVAAVLGVPLAASVFGVIYRERGACWSRVARMADLPLGKAVPLNFECTGKEAYMYRTAARNAWAVRHSETDVTVFSPICTHLGCQVDFDARTRRFICPCHASIFGITGEVIGGPAPRPLDTLPHRVEGGELYVEYQRFEPGIAEKRQV